MRLMRCLLPPCPAHLPACSILRESAWELELKGDVTRQRRLEAVDKLMSVLTLVVAAVFGVQALGLDVNSGGWVGGWLAGCGSAKFWALLSTGM
jgi:MscS family membrane protein